MNKDDDNKNTMNDETTLSRLQDIYRQKYRPWTLYVLSFTLTSLIGGLVYGWPALREQLLENDGSTLSESQLGIVFTVGSWSTQGGRFFVGLARDRFGTKRVICCCMVLVTVGCIGIGLSDPNNVTSLTCSLFFVGLGSGVQLCTQPVASLFPNHVGIMLSSLSGAFQISGLIFLALTSGSRPRSFSFLVYAGALVVMTVVATIFYPRGKSFLPKNNKRSTCLKETNSTDNTRTIPPTAKQSKNDESENGTKTEPFSASLSDSGQTEDDADKDDTKVNQQEQGLVKSKEKSSDSLSQVKESDETSDASTSNADDSFTAFQQMKTSEYILLCLWFSICLVPMQYYVGTIGFQLEERGDDTGLYTDLFAYTYAGATVTAPMAGFLADKFGLGVAQGVATGLVAFSLFLLASKGISLNVQIIGLVAYGIGRMAIFGIFFTNCGKRFGYSNYGTLAGLGLLTSAVFSLLQYPLIASASTGQSSLINTVLGIILVVQTPYFVWLYRRERNYESANSTIRK